jgi:hypothetical protein
MSSAAVMILEQFSLKSTQFAHISGQKFGSTAIIASCTAKKVTFETKSAFIA